MVQPGRRSRYQSYAFRQQIMFHSVPKYITKVLHLLQLTAVSSRRVERKNSAIKYIKRASRSTLSKEWLNVFLPLYGYQDININVESLDEMYTRKQPKIMLLLNPLAEEHNLVRCYSHRFWRNEHNVRYYFLGIH